VKKHAALSGGKKNPAIEKRGRETIISSEGKSKGF